MFRKFAVMKKNGFTLIEVLIASLLIGIAVVSLIGANISFTKVNGFGTDLSTAEFLIEQIRELTTVVEYENLSDYDNSNFSPPLGVNGEVLNGFTAFAQQVFVENVSASNFETVVADGSSDFVKITVKVLLNGREISENSWIRARY